MCYRTVMTTAAVAFGSALAAQVYVVAAGGGGNFLDLPAAIAAVPDGSTLHVQPGAYSEFTISGTGSLSVPSVCASASRSATKRGSPRNKDFAELFALLNTRGVEFIVIGGVATQKH